MNIDQLVQTGRVHRCVYQDPEIFKLELEKIFSATWIYVGHESQVSQAGAYFCTNIASQPVVMARHTDNKIRVLYNRCAHRGAKVVNCESGHSESFKCCYHGWEYSNDGNLIAVPQPRGYREDAVRPGDPAYAMKPVPRCDNYRGFVFASLSSRVPSLEKFLGPITKSFDDLISGKNKYSFDEIREKIKDIPEENDEKLILKGLLEIEGKKSFTFFKEYF